MTCPFPDNATLKCLRSTLFLSQQIRAQKLLDKQKAEANAKKETDLEVKEENDNKDNDEAIPPPSRTSAIAEHGTWRVVHSEKYNKPFFFNSLTNKGQFKVPSELLSIYGSSSPLCVEEKCSPTQQKEEDGEYDEDNNSWKDTENGIVFGTYQSLNDTEDEVFERSHGDDVDDAVDGAVTWSPAGGQCGLPCTLLDSQKQTTPSLHTSPHSAVHSPPDVFMRSPIRATLDSSIKTPVSSASSPSLGTDSAFQGGLHSSSALGGAAPMMDGLDSTVCQSEDNHNEDSGANDTQVSSGEQHDQSESNECPFCTFINPPLCLVCEICLGEISQVTVSMRQEKYFAKYIDATSF